MLESKQYSDVWYSFDCSAVHSFFDLSKKYLQTIVYLLSPEDTTEMTDKHTRSHNEIEGLAPVNARSYLKVVCWVGIAVGLSLALGQLR